MRGYPPLCPRFQRALRLLGERWTGLILAALMDGPHRFSEVARRVEGISDRLLSQRLKALEREGLVERQVSAHGPVQVVYSLTEKGRDLHEVVECLHRWAERWAGEEATRTGPPRSLPGCR